MLSGAALFSGFYLNELLMKLLARGDAHPVLFDAYTATLPALAAEQDTLTQAALRAFEIVLLREVGLLPQLDHVTTTQQAVQAEHHYMLRPELGVVPRSHGEAPLSGALLCQMQQALDGGDLRSLQSACAQGLASLKTTLRQTLHYHLGTARLRTRDVMLASQQLIERPVPPPSK
jgi:DNA repair protein RecO (recombination protein O)